MDVDDLEGAMEIEVNADTDAVVDVADDREPHQSWEERMIIQGVVGSPGQTQGVGVVGNVRIGQLNDQIVSQLHGTYYEQTYRGAVFSGGTTIAALSANTITLTATTTPILGIYNPSTSQVNAVILRANLTVVPNNLTSGAGPGAFVWAASTGNTAVSTGSAPWNRKTLATSPASLCKYFPLSGPTALTGLTNNLVIMGGAAFSSPSALTYTTLASTAPFAAHGGVDEINGSIIVPPGGVLALLNTTSCTTFSAFGNLVWEEVPV